MRRFVAKERRPFFLLLLLPFLSHAPLFLFATSSDPLWYYSWVTTGTHQGLLPGGPYLDPNVGFVTQALGALAARDWLHGTLPWWNFFTGIGMPLAGTMQAQAFFLPFILLLLLPGGILLLTIAMQLVAGATSFLLLRRLGCTRLAATAGAALCELSSVIAWTPGPSAVFCALPFLPLVLLGLELAREPGRGPAARVAIGTGIAFMVLAGFPETAYLNGVFALCWALLRLATAARRAEYAGRVIVGGLIGLALAAPQLIAFVDLLVQSNAVAIHVQPEGGLPLAALGMTLLPYGTGPLGFSSGSNLLIHIWASIGGYSGILLPLVALAGFFVRRREGLTWLLAGWVALMLARTFGFAPAAAVLHLVPFMPDVQLFRYAPSSWGFALIILAAFGLDALPRSRRAMGIATKAAALALLAAAFLLWPGQKYWGFPAASLGPVRLAWGLMLAWAFLLLALAWLCRRHERAMAGLLVAEALAYFWVPQLSAVRPGHVDRAPMAFFRAQQGFPRTFSLMPMLPNYGAYFGVANIDYNLIPIPERFADYVQTKLFPGPPAGATSIIFWPSFLVYGRNAGSDAVQKYRENYEEIGVRYVLAWPGTKLAGLQRVFGSDTMDVYELPHPAPYFEIAGTGHCRLSVRGRNRLQADCAQATALTRRELYMPGWHARVNGREVALGPSRTLFQSIPLPAGRSRIRFAYTPPYATGAWLAFCCGILVLLQQIWRNKSRAP